MATKMTQEERSAWRDYAAQLARDGLKAEATDVREMLALDRKATR